MEVTNSSDYTSVGDRVSKTYDSLEMANVNIQGEHLDQENKIEETVADHKTLIANVKCSNRRIFTGVAVTLIAIFVIAFAVMVYMFVSSNNAGKIGGTGYCPKYIANGTVVNTTGSNHGDIIELNCDEESKLIGPRVITCLSTGKWSANSHCKPRMCSNFQVPDNMKLESEIRSASVWAKVYVSCNEGFVQTGNNTVVCLSNETWSGGPVCEAVDCGVPMSVSNAELHGLVKTTFNNTFVVECLEGYKMVGSDTVRCKPSGHWNVMPTCNKISCGLPKIPLNGSISHISGTTFQATASLKCDFGFIIRGDPVINCLANGSWSSIPTCHEYGVFNDCFEVFHQGNIKQDGIYYIATWTSQRQIQVYCDMTTAGGGWTVFQNRFDGSVDFYRNFSEYDVGFGHMNGEFWLGLTFIQEIAAQGNTELRIDLEAANGSKAFVTYSRFSLAVGKQYTLHVGNISSSSRISGDKFKSTHSGNAFSTYDRDLDNSTRNCAKQYHGGWWYNSCATSNLNGWYITPGTRGNWIGVMFDSFIHGDSLKCTRMMLRRISNV